MSPLTFFAPAKINLFLAVTGQRTDGYHDLVSVVTTVNFGDELRVEPTDSRAYSLSCDTAGVPVDDANLVLRAAKLFSSTVPSAPRVHFLLKKRIPMGAGLGGGSSDGVTALIALNEMAGRPLPESKLFELAASLGSDCPLFLKGGSGVIRGRGERFERLPESASRRISRRRILLFKPGFSINTAWAYQQMAVLTPASYLRPAAAESQLAAWVNSDHSAEQLLFNNLETPAFAKYVALPVLLDSLRAQFDLAAEMSGSGSACFALLKPRHDGAEISAFIRAAWGEHSFIVEAETT